MASQKPIFEKRICRIFQKDKRSFDFKGFLDLQNIFSFNIECQQTFQLQL
jgi:hypothetical protein